MPSPTLARVNPKKMEETKSFLLNPNQPAFKKPLKENVNRIIQNDNTNNNNNNNKIRMGNLALNEFSQLYPSNMNQEASGFYLSRHGNQDDSNDDDGNQSNENSIDFKNQIGTGSNNMPSDMEFIDDFDLINNSIENEDFYFSSNSEQQQQQINNNNSNNNNSGSFFDTIPIERKEEQPVLDQTTRPTSSSTITNSIWNNDYADPTNAALMSTEMEVDTTTESTPMVVMLSTFATNLNYSIPFDIPYYSQSNDSSSLSSNFSTTAMPTVTENNEETNIQTTMQTNDFVLGISSYDE